MARDGSTLRWMGAIVVLCCCGCQMTGSESLEVELRAREKEIQALQSRLADTEHRARNARAEASRLRASLKNQDAVPRQEQLAAGYAVQELKIHSLLTGVMDDGHIHVVLRPVDRDSDLVKLPGSIEVRLVNLSAPTNQQLGKWKWTAEESRGLWSSAAIGAGYVLDLPPVAIPPEAELVLHARFQPSDGRRFEASHLLEPGGSVSPDLRTQSQAAFTPGN